MYSILIYRLILNLQKMLFLELKVYFLIFTIFCNIEAQKELAVEEKLRVSILLGLFIL